ncbi:MAG: hypothetical protein JWM86_1780 [Thermoleophilia bacterium]|nr:hypothetical protein [Thermoleophilia bacterium]
MTTDELFTNAVGEWEGDYRLWLRGGEQPDAESATRATVTSELHGGTLLLRYDWRYEARGQAGLAIITRTGDGGIEMGWSDTFHSATGVMHNDAVGTAATVYATYGPADAPWGWRTEFKMPSADELVIRAYNIPHGRPEAIATEASYRRVG